MWFKVNRYIHFPLDLKEATKKNFYFFRRKPVTLPTRENIQRVAGGQSVPHGSIPWQVYLACVQSVPYGSTPWQIYLTCVQSVPHVTMYRYFLAGIDLTCI